MKLNLSKEADGSTAGRIIEGRIIGCSEKRVVNRISDSENGKYKLEYLIIGSGNECSDANTHAILSDYQLSCMSDDWTPFTGIFVSSQMN